MFFIKGKIKNFFNFINRIYRSLYNVNYSFESFSLYIKGERKRKKGVEERKDERKRWEKEEEREKDGDGERESKREIEGKEWCGGREEGMKGIGGEKKGKEVGYYLYRSFWNF